MSVNLIFMLLIGNCIGEYFIQSNSIYVLKNYDSKWCALHSLMYTFSILLCIVFDFFKSSNSIIHFIMLGLFIFCSHFLIDRLNLVDKWLHLIKSRSDNLTSINVAQSTSKLYSLYEAAYTSIFQTIANNVLYVLTIYLYLRIVLKIS